MLAPFTNIIIFKMTKITLSLFKVVDYQYISKVQSFDKESFDGAAFQVHNFRAFKNTTWLVFWACS